MSSGTKYWIAYAVGLCVTFGHCGRVAADLGMNMGEAPTFFAALMWAVFWPVFWLIKMGMLLL